MDLTGKTVVLTGATSGIGLALARVLAGRVGLLVLHGPEEPDEVRDRLPAPAAYLQADYTELAAVARLASQIRALAGTVDVLVNNAARPGPPTRTTTADGHEVTFQINYLGPVALTALLPPPVRVVNVASATHFSARLDLDDLELSRHAYAPDVAYANSKLALVTETCRLAGTLRASAATAVGVHPGIIDTALLHAMFSLRGDTPDHAAGNLLHVLTRDHDNGTYYDERQPATPNPQALDPAVQRRLHDRTTGLIRAGGGGAP